jgi:Zn-dependent peptidase ImmA (M78 family)
MAIHIRPEVLGARLKAARTVVNLTQEEAAGRLRLARTTLLAIEAGKRAVRPDELRAFAELYEVRESELLGGSRQPLDLDVKFRSSGLGPRDVKARTLETAKAGAKKLLNRLAATVLELEELLDLPSTQAAYPEWHINPDQSLEDQAEDAALMLRQRLGIGMGPIPDLKALLELELRTHVFERPLPAGISGACSFHKQYGGFVLLNANHWVERRQQTAAHEIGHGMVRPEQPAVVVETEEFVDKEDKFCDLFARALLMPGVAVRRRAADVKGPGPLTVRHVLLLSAYFRVSIESMARRLEALSLMPRGTYDSLKERGLGRKHLEQVVKEAELSTSYPGFTPRLMFLVGEAYSRGLLSEQLIAEKLDLDLISVREALEASELHGTGRRKSAA